MLGGNHGRRPTVAAHQACRAVVPYSWHRGISPVFVYSFVSTVMTHAALAKLLVEGPKPQAVPGQKVEVDKKVSVYLTRLLLRLFSVPALMASLADVALINDKNVEQGPYKIQLDFMRLPDEVYPQLLKLCAAPREPKFYKYTKSGSARTGLELEIKPDDFGGDDYDYAT